MLVVQAPAKLNLTLHIVGRRADGYHFIESVMQSIDLCDYVTLTPVSREAGVGVSASGEPSSPTHDSAVVRLQGNGVKADDVPTDETNLAYRAVTALKDAVLNGHGPRSAVAGGEGRISADQLPHLSIHIDKRIPVAAGLGGGSANAAAALIGANELWGLHLDKSELATVGGRLGADIPFCVFGGTAVARGIGEQLTPAPDAPPLAGVVVTPDLRVSTAAVYALYDEWVDAARGGTVRSGAPADNGASAALAAGDEEAVRQRTDAMLAALRSGNVEEVARLMFNALEPVTTRLHPEVGALRDELLGAGAVGAVMCGSGPSVFGLALDEHHAVELAARLQRPGLFVTPCRFVGSGQRILEKERRT